MDVKLPKLGEGADSGVVVTVFVKEGDEIQKDQPIIELENEKAVASIPAPAAGKVSQIFVKPGDKVTVGQRLLSLGGERPAAAPAAPEQALSPAPQPAAPAPKAVRAVGPPLEEPLETPSGQPAAASPSIRHLAQELGIDLSRIRGSDRGGRIVMADLRAYIQRLQRLAEQTRSAAPAVSKPAAEPVDFAKWGPITIKPLSPLRQVVARRMGESWASVPRVTQFDEADVTAINALRKQYAPAYQQKGVRLTLTGFILKAAVGVLQKHPVFNSSLDHTEENLVFKAYFHIGVAVDTEAGLMVPVIRDVDKKSLVEISRDLEGLAAKARERKVTADELRGGTFTVSNQGGIGGGHFTPIVNRPEVAILGLGRGVVKPVWREDHVEPRTLMPMGLSYDHRVIDGGTAARFVVDLVKAIESFDESWVRI